MIRLILDSTNEVFEFGESQTIFIGRDESCQIQIESQDISRKHIQITYQDDYWTVEKLTQYGDIYVDGDTVESAKLSTSSVITFQNFIFRVEISNIKPENISNTQSKDNEIDELVDKDKSEDNVQETNKMADIDEKTHIPVDNDLSTKAHLRDLNSGDTIDILKEETLAGRDPSLDIPINSPRSSRKHFKIKKNGNTYHIVDLNSSNGTFVNNHQLPPKQEVELFSGDQIKIENITYIFEEINPEIIQQLEVINDSLDHQNHYQKVILKSNKNNKKKLVVRVGIIFISVIAIYTYFQNEKVQTKSKDQKRNISSKSEPLTQEQQRFVENSYKLANRFYTQGKYELTLLEIEKIHTIINPYRDTADIKKFSQQAIETLAEQQEIKKREEKHRKLIAKIESTINQCDQIPKKISNLIKIEQCLSFVFEHQPDNKKAENIIEDVKRIEARRKSKLAQKRYYQQRVKKGLLLFNKAHNLEKSKKYLKAIAAYNRHIASIHPDPNNLKLKSKERISQINDKMNKEIQTLIQEANSSINSKNYKKGILTLNKALELNPNHPEARNMLEQTIKTLKQQLKKIYQDSVLEESLGQVEAAKAKWQEIVSRDVPFGEYHKKARTKLKRYGH